MKKIMALFGIFFLSACATDTMHKTMPIGTTYQSNLKVGFGDTSIPLSDGKWKLIGYSTTGNNNNTPIATGVLIQENGSTISKGVIFQTPTKFEKNGYVVSKWCERKNVHFIEKKSNYAGREQDCWGVNHYKMTFRYNKIMAYKQAQDYMKKNKLVLPLAMIATKHRKANSFKFLEVTYFFNPELEGFPPPKIANWGSSDWHPERITNDKAKVAYIDRIKEWGKTWDSKVSEHFNR